MAIDHAERAITIANELGLHARAATKFVQIAGKFPSDVTVEKDGHEVNGKSIMGVLMLVASKGTTIVIRAKGPQAPDAVAALAKLVEDKFGEER
ncbi:MAG: HPr family phosphocarrier protein [Myxococcales bacterium]|nr:HPr family phosphocarrier protein [Myxococcales bacterium]